MTDGAAERACRNFLLHFLKKDVTIDCIKVENR